MHRSKLYISSFILLVAALAVCNVVYDVYLDSRSLVVSGSVDMKSHEVDFESVKYCIPDAYFRWQNHLRGEQGYGIDLSMEINSLEPWRKYSEEAELLSEGTNLDYKPVNDALASELGVKLLSQTLEARQYVWHQILGDIGGAQQRGEYYRFESNSKARLELDYYLVPQRKADYSWVLGCVSGARCRLESHLDQKITYVLSFDEKHLGSVSLLEAKVQNFFRNRICQKI